MEAKRFSVNIKPELHGFSDTFKLCLLDKNGNPDIENPEVVTKNNLTWLDQLLCKLKLRNYAGDAVMNYFLSDISTYLSTKYLYCSVGTDGTNGSTYTYTDLIAPVMTRVATTNTISTTNVTNATVNFTAIFTASGDYTLLEAGLHTTLAGTTGMGARQIFYDWDVTNGQKFAGIWEIINNRGV
jgi:hypothetical protein